MSAMIKTAGLAFVTCAAIGLAPSIAAAKRDGTQFVAASPNLERVLFSTKAPLLPSDNDECRDVYLRDGDDLELATPQREGSGFCGSGWAEAGERVSAFALDTRARLSSSDQDLSRDVYFWSEGTLVQLAAEADRPVMLRDISTDESSVFVRTKASLSPDDADGRHDIYRWRNGDLSLVSIGTEEHVRFAPTLNRTGSRAFFTTREPLLPEDQDPGCSFDACEDVYMWEEGSVTLLSSPVSDPSASGASLSRISENGEAAYFQTGESLTAGDDNESVDVYRWSDGSLDRITPDPTREAATTGFDVFSVAEDNGAGTVVATYQPLEPSDTDEAWDLYVLAGDSIEMIDATDRPIDGQDSDIEHVSAGIGRITFSTRTALTAQDRNEIPDIYSWERASGDVSLVSGGKDERFGYYYFDGADEAGRRIVFTTNHVIHPDDSDIEGADPHVRDVESGELGLLGAGALVGPYDDLFTEAVDRAAESVIVWSYDSLTPEDSDYNIDLYLLSEGRDPKLISAKP